MLHRLDGSDELCAVLYSQCTLLIPKQFGYVFKAGFRIHDPNAPIRLLVQMLCGQPRSRDFLLARIAQRIGGGIEGKKGSRVCNTLANFFGDGCLIGDVPFVAPNADSNLRETIEERLRSLKIMSPIAKENVIGHCRSPLELSSLEP